MRWDLAVLNAPYPDRTADRDVWILDQRVRTGVTSSERDALSLDRPQAVLHELERQGNGEVQSGWTVFLTNRECPWRCLMCDLWKYTRETASPEKTIPRQIDRALQEIQSAGHPVQWIKLYNAGSFFDTGAVPPSDYPEIAQRIQSIPKIIVESHPRLIGDRTWHFQKLLDPLQPGRLEVAMGLETVHPDVLNKLNKRMTTADYADATRRLKEHGCDVRAFVLIKPPFLDEAQALEWACRSLDQAFDWGVDVVTLIPVRFGNGALETLAARGQFHPPRLETLLAAFDYGRGLNRGRVFLDLWDLERLIPDPVVLNEMRVELERRNLRSET